MEKVKVVHISGRLWFDKVNGNTYYSAKAWVDGEVALIVSFEYGYGDCFYYETIKALNGLYDLSDAKITSEKSYGLKRDMYK